MAKTEITAASGVLNQIGQGQPPATGGLVAPPASAGGGSGAAFLSLLGDVAIGALNADWFILQYDRGQKKWVNQKNLEVGENYIHFGGGGDYNDYGRIESGTGVLEIFTISLGGQSEGMWLCTNIGPGGGGRPLWVGDDLGDWNPIDPAPGKLCLRGDFWLNGGIIAEGGLATSDQQDGKTIYVDASGFLKLSSSGS